MNEEKEHKKPFWKKAPSAEEQLDRFSLSYMRKP